MSAVRARAMLAAAAAALGGMLSIASASGAGATGELYGRVVGSPAGSLFSFVAAVDTRGVVLDDVAPKAGSGDVRFFLDPSTYVVVASAAGRNGTSLDGGSRPTLVAAGRHVPVAVDLKAVKAPLARVAAGPPAANGAVVSVASVLVSDPVLGSTLRDADLHATLINRLFDECASQGTVIVETDPQFVTYALQERSLSLSGALSTPFQYRPLSPQFELTGQVEVTRAENEPATHNVGLKVRLALVRLSSGGAVATAMATIAEGNASISPEQLAGAVAQAVHRLAVAACGASALVP